MSDTTVERIDLGGSAGETGLTEATWIGNATVLLRLGGFTVLTDPNFLHAGDHVPLGGGLRSRRLKEPALRIDELPPLDLVVLSHHHGDHFDAVAADGLDADVPIVTTPHAARKLRRQGFRRPIALETWEACTFARGEMELRITALPAQHGPAALARVLPETMGSLLEVRGAGGVPGYRLYQSGDTIMIDALHDIARRHPGIDCALLHLGETRVLGVLLTADAAHGLQILRAVKPRHAVPVHIDDYTIQRMTLGGFLRDVERAGDLPSEIHPLPRGEARPLP
jgi:L-ascorbate metabolism protein UlaG (beta-lactamase superfamily)